MSRRAAAAATIFLLGTLLGWSSGAFTLAAPDDKPDEGQGGEQPPPAWNDTAVIEMSQVFQEFGKFQRQMVKLKQEIDAMERVLLAGKDEIEKLVSRANGLPDGSRERDELEVEAEAVKQRLQRLATRKREEVLDREAELYARSYAEIETEVKRFSRLRRIRLVLRYSNVPADLKDRKSVLQVVNRPVVYQEGLDITQEIIQRLNEQYPQSPA